MLQLISKTSRFGRCASILAIGVTLFVLAVYYSVQAQTLGASKQKLIIVKVIRDGAPLYARASGSSEIVRTAALEEEFPRIDQIQGYYLVKDEVSGGFLYLDPLDAVLTSDLVDLPEPQAYIRDPDEDWYWLDTAFFVIEDEYTPTYHSGRYSPNFDYTPRADPSGLISTAMEYMGIPYVWGGETSTGVDCSGLVLKCLGAQGFKITHKASVQAKYGLFVAYRDLRPGDVLFFTDKKHNQIGHTGIYLGGGRFIHAASSLGKVGISNLGEKYYSDHYLFARRY